MLILDIESALFCQSSSWRREVYAESCGGMLRIPRLSDPRTTSSVVPQTNESYPRTRRHGAENDLERTEGYRLLTWTGTNTGGNCPTSRRK